MINIKKQKEKFLEDYFSLCLEHGFCIDVDYPDYLQNEVIKLVVVDTPSYTSTIGDVWGDIKKELRKSI